MAWGSDTTLGSQTAINDTVEEFLPSGGGGIELEPGESAHVQLQIDNTSGSVTNGVIISVYTTLDTTSEDWDERPYRQLTYVPDGITAEDWSFIVSDVFSFRIGLLAAAAADDYDVGGNYRLNGIAL
jgi:hypothetical protein